MKERWSVKEMEALYIDYYFYEIFYKNEGEWYLLMGYLKWQEWRKIAFV